MSNRHDCDHDKLLCPARENLLSDLAAMRKVVEAARQYIAASNDLPAVMQTQDQWEALVDALAALTPSKETPSHE